MKITYLQERKINGKYLVTLLFQGNSMLELFDNLIPRVTSRIEGWKTKLLSQAGRTTLIKLVTKSIPTYQMSIFSMPKTTNSKTNAIQGKKKSSKKILYLKKWFHITKPVSVGGIGIRDVQTMNKALHARIAWRISLHPDDPCATLFKQKYFPNSKPSLQKKSPSSWFRKSFLKEKDILLNNAV